MKPSYRAPFGFRLQIIRGTVPHPLPTDARTLGEAISAGLGALSAPELCGERLALRVFERLGGDLDTPARVGRLCASYVRTERGTVCTLHGPTVPEQADESAPTFGLASETRT